MTPSHLHLCISMCMYSPFTPQMQISTYLQPDFVCKAIVPTLAPGRTKKKGERWAVSGATEPCDTYWSAPRYLHVLRSMPSDFSAKVLGQGQQSTFGKGFGKLPQDPQKISKKSEEREATGPKWIYFIYLAMKGQKFNFSKCGSNSITDRISFQGLEGNPTLGRKSTLQVNNQTSCESD